MNAQDQADIDRLNKLLALPPSAWLAAEDEATHLIESLADRLSDTHPLMVELDGRFVAAQKAGERGQECVSSNPPSPVPQLPTVEIPPADPTLLQDKTPLGVALNTLVGQGRFDLRRRLQAGHYSAGYSALDRQTSAHVVVKLPTNEGYAWASRFKECDDALATEAMILPLASTVINAAPAGSARPVEHVAAGELSIPQVWPLPVHWLVQRFAQGQRVSEIVPMREAREVDGLHILRQVITMVRLLYAANLTHCDLREDALFWDGTQVEVINWNRATQQPTKDDLQREFEALQRLASTIFFGLSQAWGTSKANFASESHAYASELLVTFSGLPLSRGTRMLLFRSLSADHPAAITSVDALHTAVMEQCVYWDQPTTQQPVVSEQTPRTISALLDRVAVEYQRPAETSLAPAERLTWVIESYAQARTVAIRHLRIWFSVPEDLRTSFPRLEVAWFWLPDVWPLALLVPLSKLWFFRVARELDNQLVKLTSQIVAGQLEDAAATARQLAIAMPPPLAALLQQIAKSADAYLTLDRIELAFKVDQPDYAAALRTLKQIREIIPFEPRTLVVLRLLETGDQRNGRTMLLLEELDQISQRAPKNLSRTQRRLLATLEELRGLGQDDPRYASQQQTVTVLDAVEGALASARPYADAGIWDEVITRLTPWHDRLDVRDVASDLYVKVEKLFGDAQDYRIHRHRREFFEHVQNALALGDLKQIQQLCEDALQTFDGNASVLAQVESLEQAITPLINAVTSLQNGDAAKLTRLKPETYPEICYPLVQQINAMTEARRTLTAATTTDALETLQAALTQAQQIPLDLPPPLLAVRRTLISEAGARVQELFHRRIASGATLTDKELNSYEVALSQVQAAVGSAEPALLTTQVLLAQRREQQLTAQVSQGQTALTTALDTTSSQICDALTTALDTTSSQTSNVIKQVKTDLEARVSAIQNAQKDLARSDNLINVQQEITKQLDNLSRHNAEVSATISTITQRQVSSATLSQELSKQITIINQRIDILSNNDKVLIAGQQAISEKLDVREKATKPQPSLVSVISVRAIVVSIIVLAFLFGMILQYRLSGAPSTAAVPSPITATIAKPKATIPAAAATTVAQATKQPTLTLAPSSTAPSAEIPSPVPSTTHPVTSTINLSNTLMAQLGETVDIPAEISVFSETARLYIGSLSVPIPIVVGFGTASITIPETLLLTNTLDFALPINSTLSIGDQTVPLRIEPSILTVGKVVQRDGESERGPPRGELWAWLWNDPSKRNDLLQDTVKINGAKPKQPNIVVLLQGDQIKLLEGKGDFYKIEVVTNKADGKNAVGQIGWIRKTLVHGGQ